MLNTDKQAENLVKMLEDNCHAFNDLPDFNFDEKHRAFLVSVLQTELGFAKQQGALEFKESIKKEFIHLMDLAANYDYLKSQASRLRHILGLDEEE